MRDPNRILPILDAVREVWERDPDLRLGQLIVNAIRPRHPVPEVFSAEDDRVVAGLARIGQPPHHDPTTVDLQLTPNEALVLLGVLLRFGTAKRLASTDAVEEQVLDGLRDDLMNGLAAARALPPAPADAVIERAKRELTGG